MDSDKALSWSSVMVLQVPERRPNLERGQGRDDQGRLKVPFVSKAFTMQSLHRVDNRKECSNWVRRACWRPEYKLNWGNCDVKNA
jgi:hypothetical protein